MKKSIYFLGFRGAGKSYLSRELSARLSCSYFDLDIELEKRLGETILSYIDRCGLETFRIKECEFLRETELRSVGAEPALFATGGGVVDWPPSRAIFRASRNERVYLDTSPQLLWERLEGSPERRKIHNLDSFSRLEALLQERSPHYETLATHTVKNENLETSLRLLEAYCRSVWHD